MAETPVPAQVQLISKSRSIVPWVVGGVVIAGAAGVIAYVLTRSHVNIADYSFAVDIVNPVIPRAGTAQIEVSITNNSEDVVSPVLRFDIWPSGHTPVEGSPQSVGNIDPGETILVTLSYILPSNWGGGTELNAQLMLIGASDPVWNVVSGWTVQGDIDTGVLELISVVAVNPTLVAGEQQQAKVTVILNNTTASTINRTFRLDVKGHDKLTWHEGNAKTVSLSAGMQTSFSLVCSIPTDWDESNSPVAIKIMDIGESQVFYGDVDGSSQYQIFEIIPESQLAAYSSESFIISQVPADRLVVNGQEISFTLGFKHIGGPKNYKAGCYIKTESPYWITQDFSCPADKNWTVRQVTVSGVFRSNLGSGRVIDELMAFMEASIVTPSVPARDEELLFANWDAALTIR